MEAMTVRTPTKPRRERIQSGPEHGRTWHKREIRTTAPHTREDNPPAHSGLRSRPIVASTHTREIIMTAPHRRMRTPVAIRAGLSLSASRRIWYPPITIGSPNKSGKARRMRPVLISRIVML